MLTTLDTTKPKDSGDVAKPGSALLEAIRLLVEMAPQERAALIAFLKAFG